MIQGTPQITADRKSVTFSVVYVDDEFVQLSSIDSNDVVIVTPANPASTQKPVTLTKVSRADAGRTSDTLQDAFALKADYRFVAPSGTFTAADAGTYTINLQANQVLATNGQGVTAGTLATFDVPAQPPPLTVTMNGTLPAAVVGGVRHKSNVPVLVTNSSGSMFGGVVTVNLYVSADQTLDGGDTAFAQAGKKLKLKQGASKTVKVKVNSFPGGVPDGDYTVIADVVDKNQIHSTGVAADPVHIAARSATSA